MGYFPDFSDIMGGQGIGEFTDWMGGWGMLVFLSMMVVIFFYILVYMFSYFIRSEEMKRSAFAHFMDAVMTALLAIMIITIMGAAFSFLQDYYTGATVSCDLYGTMNLNQSSGPFQIIKCRLQEKASGVSALYERVYQSARDPFKKLGMYWGLLGIPIYQNGAFIGQSAISPIYTAVETARMLTHICVALLIGINGYIGAIDYIYTNMIRMFLPIGIVLRAIPFTRSIGAFFMALGVGFYIIFPFAFAITDPTFVNIPPGAYVDLTDKSAITFPWPTFTGAISLATVGPQDPAGSQLFGFADAKQVGTSLSKLYYGLIIHPIVILSITMIFVRYMTSLFGGESQELYRLATKVV